MDFENVTNRIINMVRERIDTGVYEHYSFYYDSSDSVNVSLGWFKSATFGLSDEVFFFYVSRFWTTYSIEVSEEVKNEFTEYVHQAKHNASKQKSVNAQSRREKFFKSFL